MITNSFPQSSLKVSSLLCLVFALLLAATAPATAQTTNTADPIKPLRADVGINGLTVNLHRFSNFTYLKNDTLAMDGSSELEFVFRDIRMMTPRLGVGFQVLTSFFVDSPNASFGIGSWGLGPVVRAYPFKTERFQPYMQAKALLGNNMALSTMANSKEGGNGFRVRLGLRAGLAYRITNAFGLFVEAGYDWESGRIFRADARALQFNVGIDIYRFN